MGRKKDKEILLDAAKSWLDELESEIVPNVLTEEERESYSRQATELRGALERRSLREAARQAGGTKPAEQVDPQAQRNLAKAIAR